MERTDVGAQEQSRERSTPEIRGVRWLRVLILGVAAEVALMVVAAPALFLADPQRVLNIAIAPASFVVLAIFGYWAARPLKRLQPLNGLLTGAAAVLFYVGTTAAAMSASNAPEANFSSTLAPAYLLAHALKLLGGWIGGIIAARRAHQP